MNIERQCELEVFLRQGIKKAFPDQKITWQGLGEDQDNNLTVGDHTQIWLVCQGIKPDSFAKRPRRLETFARHKILIRSAQVKKQKQFQEDKKGWINVDAIINEAVYRLRLEREHRLIADEKGRQYFTAQTEAQRLRSHYGPGIDKQARISDDGSITAGVQGAETRLAVSFSGLTPKEAHRLLEAARKVKVLPSSKRVRDNTKIRTLWQHLQDDEK